MRIYKIVNEKIHSLKIKRLGNICILQEPSNAFFNWRHVFEEKHCSFSIKDAFEKEIAAQNKLKQWHIKEISGIDLRLVILKRNLHSVVQNERNYGSNS